MEQHGNSTQNKVIAILPARYDSVRLPGKLLLDLGGKPVIWHTLTQVAKAKSIDKVIVATDSELVREAVEGFGFECVMTDSNHQSGTDRIAEAIANFDGFEIIVNVQSDEPFIDPKTIDRTVETLEGQAEADMSTAYELVSDIEQILDPNCVKAVVSDNGRCVYFSRSAVPYPRDMVIENGSLEKAILANNDETYKKHVGLYVYRREFLLSYSAAKPTKLERTESLEQLRALEMGAVIYACEAVSGSIGIDTEEDLMDARRHIGSISDV